MAKRKADDSYDNPIGLTQAFAPVAPSITGELAPVEDVEEIDWDTSAKWEGFDWEAASEHYAEKAAEEQAAAEAAAQAAAAAAEQEPVRKRGRHAAHAVAVRDNEIPVEELPLDPWEEEAADSAETADLKAGIPELAPSRMEERMNQSRRTRKTLIIVIVLLFVLLGALGFFIYQIYTESQTLAAQQTQEQTAADDTKIDNAAGKDQAPTAVKTTTAVDLTSLLGKTQDEALAIIKRGAIVTSTRDATEEGSAIKKNVTVSLSEEPTVSKTGAPTVYLGLNEGGRIIQAGYSSPASLLGFSSPSFKDAVTVEHVIEKTLKETGVDVAEGSIALPDRSQYATYAADGKTLVRERCAFSGDVNVNGAPCTWSAVLSYDYTATNLSGNMSDTVRIIYAYVTQN